MTEGIIPPVPSAWGPWSSARGNEPVRVLIQFQTYQLLTQGTCARKRAHGVEHEAALMADWDQLIYAIQSYASISVGQW